jgi:hypothetical protein
MLVLRRRTFKKYEDCVISVNITRNCYVLPVILMCVVELVTKRTKLANGVSKNEFCFFGTIKINNATLSLSPPPLGSTVQLRPWSPPQNPAEFLGGFSTIFFFYRVGLLAPRPTPILEDQAPVFISPRGRVSQLYPRARGTHFSRLLRHAWVTVGLFLFLFHGHHRGKITQLVDKKENRTSERHSIDTSVGLRRAQIQFRMKEMHRFVKLVM